MLKYQIQTEKREFKSEMCRDAIELSVGRLITSASYSPETMSVIERSCRIIGEMASTMLLHVELGVEFCEEATTMQSTFTIVSPRPSQTTRETCVFL